MENNIEQSAVDWLVEQYKKVGGISISMAEKAKQMEKQAHEETWDVAHQAGRFEGKGIAEENWQTFETYWE